MENSSLIVLLYFLSPSSSVQLHYLPWQFGCCCQSFQLQVYQLPLLPDPLIFLCWDSDDVQAWTDTSTCFSLCCPGEAECCWIKSTAQVWSQLLANFQSHSKTLHPALVGCLAYSAMMTLSLVFIFRLPIRLLPSFSQLMNEWSVYRENWDGELLRLANWNLFTSLFLFPTAPARRF